MRRLFDKGYGPLLIITMILIGFYIGVFFTKRMTKNFRLSKDQKKMQDLIYFIDNNYVDKINTDSIVNQAINYILSDLDPHSKYIPSKWVQTVDEDLQGEFVGVGISYTIINDTVFVLRVLKESPNKKKLSRGDKLLSANGHNLTGDSTSLVSKYLKGLEDTYVKVKLIRNQKKITEKLIRKKIINSPIQAAYMLNDSIGFIRLSRFTFNAGDIITENIDRLKSKGMKTLILDLRGNGGGFLKEATKIADDFLADGKVMYYIKGRNHKKQETRATGKGNFEKGNLYVLIDGDTASASELLAGAIQDQDRGIIVGRRSFGKGLVQKEISLSDGSKVRLTIARYYTPTGRSIQKPYHKGESGMQAYQKESYQRYFSGEMYSSDSIKINDSLKFKTPQGKIVYGGGGIIPDVFIAADTFPLENWHYFHRNHVNIFDYMNRFIFEHKNTLKNWDFESFNNNFEVDKIYAGYLKTFKQKVEISTTGKVKIKSWLKALIARNFYGNEAYFKIRNQSDKYIKMILELETKKTAR